MGLTSLDVRLLLALNNRCAFGERSAALDMGAQDIDCTFEEFKSELARADMDTPDTESFDALHRYPKEKMSARALYEMLEFERYVCVDIGGGDPGGKNGDALTKRWNAHVHDLNEPLTDTKLQGAFDLVTDFGNNEHAFNVAETYRSLHRVCRSGGVIVVHQAVVGGNGFYTFSPAFFEALAAANHYEILSSAFTLAAKEFAIEPGGKREFEMGPGDELGLLYAFRKVTNDPFRTPYQDELMAAMERVAGYRVVQGHWAGSRAYLPIATSRDALRLLFSRLFGRSR